MRLLWADLMKVIAIFSVILLHVSASYLVPFAETWDWWVGNIYDSLSRWCVPLFVMVSGTLILPGAAKQPLRRFLTVRVRRILLPFLFWSAVYFLYRIHVKGDDLPLAGFVPMVLTEPIYYHLWFIYMLIILYLFAPAMSAFLNQAPERHIWYLLFLWFFWSSLMPLIEKPADMALYYSPDMDDDSPVKLSGYFLLGYVLKDRRAATRPRFFAVVAVFLAGAAATIFGTYFMSRTAGKFHPFFYKYFSITVVAMTVSIFLLVKTVFHTHRETGPDGEERIRFNSPRWLRRAGMGVFGVYLVHALVLELLRDGRLGFTIDHTTLLGMAVPPAAGIPAFAAAIFLLSLGPVLLVRTIPYLRELIT